MMISIIISSQKKEALDAVSENIAATIGVPYEIIAIQNSKGKMGICKAYNIGAAKAAFDIFCFMHEDVLFETGSWGNIVAAHLSNKKIGLIGVAGGDTKGLVPSSWSSSVFQSEISIIQHSRRTNAGPEKIVKTGYPKNDSLIKNVVCIDGVWMCTRRDVFNKCKFDDRTLKGFHGYDVDFSLQVFLQQYKVAVVFDVILHHFSDGNYSKAWMESIIAVSDKWKDSLPKTVRDLSKQELIRQHWTSMGVFLEKLSVLKYSFSERRILFLKYSFNRFFHLKHFLHFFKLLLVNDFKSEEE